MKEKISKEEQQKIIDEFYNLDKAVYESKYKAGTLARLDDEMTSQIHKLEKQIENCSKMREGADLIDTLIKKIFKDYTKIVQDELDELTKQLQFVNRIDIQKQLFAKHIHGNTTHSKYLLTKWTQDYIANLKQEICDQKQILNGNISNLVESGGMLSMDYVQKWAHIGRPLLDATKSCKMLNLLAKLMVDEKHMTYEEQQIIAEMAYKYKNKEYEDVDQQNLVNMFSSPLYRGEKRMVSIKK